MSYMERYQAQPQQNGIMAKIVNDFSEITANDVSMNSPFNIFAKNDMSEIQIRKWNGMGTIDNLTFKRIENEEPSNNTKTDFESFVEASEKAQMDFLKRLEAIENKIDLFAPKPRVKKEVSGDE